MHKINKLELETLYNSNEIRDFWHNSRKLKVINHPKFGWISPNQYRAKKIGHPCPYCGAKLVQGKNKNATFSREEAIERGYEYIDKSGNKVINQAGETFFHPHYTNIDHKINKARCPEKMFDYDNLQVICWRCNQEKRDSNSFELQHKQKSLDSLAEEALDRYKLL